MCVECRDTSFYVMIYNFDFSFSLIFIMFDITF
jgi:hypothetical protein